MKLFDIIQIFRQEADDDTEPFLWSDDDAIEYANDAQNEAARRARLLVDSSTPAICEIAVAPSDWLLDLDPRVLFVRRARFPGSRPLARMNMQDMETYNPFWQDAAPSTPFAFVPDYQTGKIVIYPPAETTRTLLLTVVRDPLAEMNDGQDAPEIAARYHRSLRFWMLYRAYSKQDSQANDPKKAADALALFEQEFGKKSSAIDEAWITREQSDNDGTF